MMTSLIGIISLSTLLGIGTSDVNNGRTYRGVALDLQKEVPLYVEEHEERYRAGERTFLLTVYRGTEGRIIARREADFSRSTLVPDFQTEDLRSGYLEGAERVAGGIRLYWRKSADGPIEERVVDIPSPAVVDAGFNNFVQEQWKALMNGEELQIHFGIPSSLDYYRFRIYKDEEILHNGRPAAVVLCEIDNFFIRLFVSPIVLVYDVETRRLVSYKGISNISDEQGNNHRVRIDYQPFGP